MVRKHSPSTSRSLSKPSVAFSAEESASNTDSGDSLISDVSSFRSAMKPNRFILSVQAQQRCDSLNMIDLLLVSLKPVPYFNMLRMHSFPSLALYPSLPVLCIHVVMVLVWWEAHSGAADLQTSHGLLAFGKSSLQLLQPGRSVQETLSSPALDLPSLKSCLLPLAHQAKQISSLHPISPQTYKLNPWQFLLVLLSWLTLPQAQAGHSCLTLQSDWECFVSTPQVWQKRKHLSAIVCWGWLQLDPLEVIQLLLSTIHNSFCSQREG